MTKPILLSVCLLGLLAGTAWAGDALCDDPTLIPRLRYRPFVSASDIASEPTCSMIEGADKPATVALIEAQRAFVAPFFAAGTQRYLKRVNGLAVEMTQGEKDAVDAILAATAAARTALVTELTTNAACSLESLADVITYLDNRHATIAAQIATLHSNTATQIEALAAANLTTLKAGLNGLNDQDQTIAQNVNDELTAVQKVIARCLFALRKLVRP